MRANNKNGINKLYQIEFLTEMRRFYLPYSLKEIERKIRRGDVETILYDNGDDTQQSYVLEWASVVNVKEV